MEKIVENLFLFKLLRHVSAKALKCCIHLKSQLFPVYHQNHLLFLISIFKYSILSKTQT